MCGVACFFVDVFLPGLLGTDVYAQGNYAPEPSLLISDAKAIKISNFFINFRDFLEKKILILIPFESNFVPVPF